MTYDSRKDTQDHINRVAQLLHEEAYELLVRAELHDQSKLEEPEKSIFDRETPLLKSLTYGSPEYKEALVRLKVALDHHYAEHSHHPEHYENGVNGMTIPDLQEHLMDCKAASERHADGDIWKSLEINRKRFGYSDQVYDILCNTAREKGW